MAPKSGDCIEFKSTFCEAKSKKILWLLDWVQGLTMMGGFEKTHNDSCLDEAREQAQAVTEVIPTAKTR
jgi:hypothetical protein